MPDSYFPLDVNFFDHPKVVPLGDTTVRMHLAAIGYANRLMTDGLIAPAIPGRLVEWDWNDTDAKNPYQMADELIRAVLWHKADEPCPRGHTKDCPELPGVEGWRIHDFLEHNRSKEKRLESQKQERDRKAAWREKQRKEREQSEADKAISGDVGVPRDTTVPGTRDSAIPGTSRGRLTETETETETPSLPPSAVTHLAEVTGVGDMPPVDNPVDSKRREGKGRTPRTPRHPSDPFVVRRAREIRERDGNAAAMAYLRTVGENFGTEDKAAQLRRLDAWMAEHGEAGER